jgi:hypothetical protein
MPDFKLTKTGRFSWTAYLDGKYFFDIVGLPEGYDAVEPTSTKPDKKAHLVKVLQALYSEKVHVIPKISHDHAPKTQEQIISSTLELRSVGLVDELVQLDAEEEIIPPSPPKKITSLRLLVSSSPKKSSATFTTSSEQENDSMEIVTKKKSTKAA